MNKLIIGRYLPGTSLLHILDARAKLIAGFYFIFILFFAEDWPAYILLWAFTFWVMHLSGVHFKTYIRGVRPLIWLILFTVCLQVLFTAGGEIYFEWGPVTISQFGIVSGIYIFFRFVMIIFISTVITLTTKPIDLTEAIHFLLKPLRIFKIPVEEISIMLSIALRFIPNLLDETQKIMDAQKARGTEFGKGSLFQQMKTLVPIFLPLFVSSLNRAEEVANVMEVRGYQPNARRSSFRKLRWKWADTLSLVIMIFLTVGLLIMNTIV
ncbi:energy-coupling factor transporter transmembrane component T family protein [Caldifermentibacillus hisashii]|jgi:energy-coupling factor transport system permease protein|uniref:energy-coupling factor transporter transmembrane component T family protein n=1 Tax=Caldifermentibacillus hisashii TaxID=996558 RepID=UPI0022B999DB|nr:energy-coupling factor transporter transmembrane component T [Caldifermentibacillus hisashii]